MTVNGQNLGTTDAVQCTEAGPLVTLTTGDDGTGVRVLVDTGDGLVVKEVSILNLGGYTGSFNAGLGGEATATMTGRTYNFEGIADGFETANPSFRSSGTFEIKVSC